MHPPERNVNLTRWFVFPVYIQNTLSWPITLAHSFSKPQMRLYIYLLKIELFLNSHYHALCAVVSFSFVTSFYLTGTGYSPNLFFKAVTLLYLKISASFFCRVYAPVSCPILSNHKLWYWHSKWRKHVGLCASSFLKATSQQYFAGAHYAPLRGLISSEMQTLIGAAIFTATPLWVWHEPCVAKLQGLFLCFLLRSHK